jgi:hypothetical protein
VVLQLRQLQLLVSGKEWMVNLMITELILLILPATLTLRLKLRGHLKY